MLQSINNRQLPGASDMQTGQVLAQELSLLLGQEEQPAESKDSKPQTSITTDQVKYDVVNSYSKLMELVN